MRITLTAHQFLPEHASGTEILTLHTAQELQRRGHEVRVFTGFPAAELVPDDQRFDTYEYGGVPVHRFKHQFVPMGGQSNIIEMEYDNHLFREHLRVFLAETPQDLVHFFHFSRLTMSAVDACVEAGVRTAFTPTDFYTICPTSQLRLADGSMCTGPSAFAANCIRHVAELSQPAAIANRLRVLPNAALAAGVVAVQNRLLPERWYSPFVRALSARPEFMRQRLNMIDRLFAPTRLMASLLIKNGVHRSRLSVVPFGVNLDHIRRDTAKGAAPALRVAFIGTLFEHKGPHLLIQAVRSLPPEVPVELSIYGNPREFPEYVASLHTLAADDPRIHFRGTFPNKDIGEVFGHLDVLVVPSIWYENTPLVIYSSMAAGCPVVATDLGGMSEAVTHEVNGLLFEKGNVAQLARHLRRLAEDRGLVARLAAHTPLPRSIPQYVDALEAGYRDVFARVRPGRAAV